MKTRVAFYDNMRIREAYKDRVKEAQEDWAAGARLRAKAKSGVTGLQNLVSRMACYVAASTLHKRPKSYCQGL
jgi:hypothetical protein